MKGPFDLEGPEFGPAGGGAPQKLVLLLHGLGADGNDLIGLAPHWAKALPAAAFVSPNAPYPCDMAPYGFQWFSLQDREPAAILAGVQAARPILDAFIDAQLERFALGEADLALVGFSQGTMMSLFTALRRDKPVAGVVGFSGALVGAELLAAELKSRPPVLLVHGDADPVVPVQASKAAKAALDAAGLSVELHIRPGLPHGIDEQGLVLGGRFLQKALKA
ncbi:MAG: alpha/beta hydrolase [Rhodospirillales bacterium]